MTLHQLSTEIRDLNLSFLLLAQAMIRSNKSLAPSRLGMSITVAEMLARAPTHQLKRLSTRNLMLCTLRPDEELVLGLLADPHTPQSRAESPARPTPSGQPQRALGSTGAAQAEAA